MSRGKKAKRQDHLLDHPRLKQREIKEWRRKMYEDQGGKCLLCGCHIEQDKAVLDHCHSSGFIRGTLHSGCNALLGKVENNYKRVGMSKEQLNGFAPSILEYIEGDYSMNPFHPSHRTQEEKRLSRNEKARKARSMRSKR